MLYGGTIEKNYISNNNCGIVTQFGSVTIRENTIIGNDVGIRLSSNATVRNNTITNNQIGIEVTEHSVSAAIERNFLFNNNVGFHIGSSEAIIKNNTITDTGIAIRLENSFLVTISYNNIENYSQHSIYLDATSNNIDATNNWWGTTDTQAINLTIRDYKYDFGLGKVSFVPFLTEPNTEATSDPIPEFPSWIIMPLFLIATFAVIIFRKRLVR